MSEYGYVIQKLREGIEAIAMADGDPRTKLIAAGPSIGMLRAPAVGIPAPIAGPLSALQAKLKHLTETAVSHDQLHEVVGELLDLYSLAIDPTA